MEDRPTPIHPEQSKKVPLSKGHPAQRASVPVDGSTWLTVDHEPGEESKSQRVEGSKDGYLFHNLIHFGRLLRNLGLDAQAGRMLDVAEALAHVDIGRRPDFYHTLQTLLVRRAQDLPVFDEAFRVFWRPPPGRAHHPGPACPG